MTKRAKPTPHPSHRTIINRAGYVRNGSIVQGHISRQAGHPPAFDAGYMSGAGTVPLPTRTLSMDPGGDAAAGPSNPMDPSAGLD
jgi:hypothetical protein